MSKQNGGTALQEVSGSSSARAPRLRRRASTSPYPLTVLTPSRSIPRFPLLAPKSSEAEAFAEETRDGKMLQDRKGYFKQSRKVAAISIPARESPTYQNCGPLKDSVLHLHKLRSLVPDPQDKSRRLLLFKIPSIADLPSEAQQFIKDSQMPISDSEVEVDWEYWTVDEILSCLLPLGLPEGTPTAFTSTGHIAHLNLRDEYLPYKYIIGQVISDKNSNVRTVVNKLDTIDSEFRFFKMERLAGDDDYEVTLSESGCSFTFDFRKVYWNSRLSTEHDRLVSLFQPYEVVSDVMAGVGPFAMPAAKKGVYVHANDLNPASYESMVFNAKRNKIEDRLHCYCEDGRYFIRESIRRCWESPWKGIPLSEEGRQLDLKGKSTSKGRAKQQHIALQGVQKTELTRGPPLRLINHFVMNLPGSALEFLDAFPGAYRSIAGEELEREMEKEGVRWPLVHVHCFTKDLQHPHEDICRRASERLGLTLDKSLVPPPSPLVDSQGKRMDPSEVDHSRLANLSLGSDPTPELSLHYVRSVAPNKDMYCLTFRLTRDILFA